MGNLDIITTSFGSRDTGEIEVRGYTFAVSTKGNKDYSISPAITYSVEIMSFKCCCINTKPVVIKLTLF